MTEHRVPGAPWRNAVRDENALRISGDLKERLDTSRPVLVTARNSTASGQKARRYAIDDLVDAVSQLAGQTGIDFGAWLPARETLDAELRSAPARTSRTPEGERLEHHYTEFDLTREVGLAVVIATGTAHQLSDHLRQPFVEHLADRLGAYQPALLAVKEGNRIARQDWAFAPVSLALRSYGIYLADETGLGPFDLGRSAVAFLTGSASCQQAATLPRQTRRGQANKTGRALEASRVVYVVNRSAPPGAATAWLRDGSTGAGVRTLFLDSPSVRPDSSEVTYGLPEVYDADGQPVDQVANVRFLLTHYGKTGWSIDQLAAELQRRKFSTEHLRDYHDDPAAVVGAYGDARTQITTVLDNLALYETGEIPIQPGAGVDAFAISGFWPPDGKPWTSAEDFSRIRRRREETASRQHRAVRLVFAGLRATFNGAPVRLTSDHRPSRQQGELNYLCALDEHYPTRKIVPDGHVKLPALELAESIVEGLCDAGELPLELVDLDVADETTARLQADLTNIDAKLERTRTQRHGLREQLEATDHAGKPVVTGIALQELQQRYNDLVDHDLPELETERARLQRALDDARAAQPEVAQTSQLLRLVHSLRDPHDLTLKDLWRASIAELHFHSSHIRTGSATGWQLEWTGVLRFTDGEDVYEVPFAGRYRKGAAEQLRRRLPDLTDEHLDAMQHGTPFTQSRVPHKRLCRPQVAERLRPGGPTPAVLDCTDGLITRIATLAHLDPDRADHDIALGVRADPALVARVREIHLVGGATTPWQRPRSKAERACYQLAVAHGGAVTAAQIAEAAGVSVGQVYNLTARLRQTTDLWTSHRKHGYKLRPCQCGALDWQLMDICEPVVAVCGACRQDLAGITWPADPYEAYAAERLV